MRRIYCRLEEIMKERGISSKRLHRDSGADRGAISALRNNTWRSLHRDTVGRICEALDITFDQLFVVFAADILFPLSIHKEVTIHVGATSDRCSWHAQGGAAEHPVLERRVIGLWDLRAYGVLSDHLNEHVPGVRVSFHPHITGVDAGIDSTVGDLVERVFKEGNHIIIGSPLSNQFAEETICRAFGVPPYTPGHRHSFPFDIVWDFPVSTASSFGLEETQEVAGIVCSRTGELVARRTFVAQGAGEDGALIVTYRVRRAPARRRLGDDDEQVIIWILGLSGPGTYAGAVVVSNPRNAAALYPTKSNQPLMSVASAEYMRPAVEGPLDNRKVTKIKLLGENGVKLTPKAA